MKESIYRSSWSEHEMLDINLLFPQVLGPVRHSV